MAQRAAQRLLIPLLIWLSGCEIVADFDRDKIKPTTTKPPGIGGPYQPIPNVDSGTPDDLDASLADAAALDGSLDAALEDASTDAALDGAVPDAALDGGPDAAVDASADDAGASDAAVDAGDAAADDAG